MTTRNRLCWSRPHAWEITGGYNADKTTGSSVQKALSAAAICNTLCPALEACRAAVEANPPTHRCVQAGLIFEPVGNYGSQSWTPEKWAEKFGVAPVIKSKLPEDAPRCVECDTPFMPTRPDREYCSRLCTHRARNRRVSEAKAALREAVAA